MATVTLLINRDKLVKHNTDPVKKTQDRCMTIATVLMTATPTIALPACPSSGYFHNCFGTYTYADGDKYVGEFKDGDLNGYAIQYRADGSILREGIFKNGEFLYAQN